MKNITSPTSGKILIHNHGVGNFSKADIMKRARELALIEGRTDITDEDYLLAVKELRGEALPATGDVDMEGTGEITRDPSEPLSDHGRQVPNYEGQDEEKIPERLVLEGVEEAQHEQMISDRRRKNS
jgi:hypothetical protein